MRSEYLRAREMEHILALLTPDNELVMRVCLYTGLRVGDVVALAAPVSRQFWITEQKTKKRRRVNLPDSLVSELNRNAFGGWCFPGRLGGHRTRQAVWRDVSRAAKALRIPVQVSPHTARKIYAVQRLRDSRGKLRTVQKALNHSDMATTMLYTMAEALYDARYEERDGRIVKRGRAGKRGRS